MITLLRIFQFAFSAFWRNIWLSVATTFAVLLALFLGSSLIFLNLLGGSALKVVENKVDLSAYLEADATPQEADVVKAQLQARPEVEKVTYISEEEALQQFQERHRDQPIIQNALEELEDNPLQSSLKVKARSPSDYAALTEYLKKDEFKGVVASVSDNSQTASKLAATTVTLSKLALWVSVAFGVIAVMIVFNAVRLAIYAQRDEISVMRLVGASNALIRAPLVIVGMLYGLLGAAFSTALLYPAARYVGPRANTFLGEASLDVAQLFLQHVFLVFTAQAVAGMILGILSSAIAIRKYLRT